MLIPSGKGAKGGVLFAGEPRYASNDHITAGLKFEGALMARVSVIGEEVEVKATSVYQVTTDYYFNTKTSDLLLALD